LSNLLDNAVRHGARRATLTLAGTTLTLVHDGRAVDEAQRRTLRAALAGADDGAGPLGLGLRLADLVARAHGGGLALPAASQGFVVELRLAAAHNPASMVPPRSLRSLPPEGASAPFGRPGGRR
jgi:K+-sensing histidine kinase KdpD